jgi:hypothetical protein
MYIWSLDVVPAYKGGWAVRRAGARKCLRLFASRGMAIEYAMKVKSTLYVFVFTRDARVQYVKRTRVKR